MKKEPKSSSTAIEAEIQPVAAPAFPPVDAHPIKKQSEQIVELLRLVGNLGVQLTEFKTANARDQQFNAAVRSVESAAAAVQHGLVPSGVPIDSAYAAVPGTAAGRRGGCEPCDCVSDQCCMFEIVLDKVRAIQPQGILEPLDAGEIPFFENPLEVRLFASVDDIGILLPSLNTAMELKVPSLLNGGGPGAWMQIGRVIHRVSVCKGTSKTVVVEFQASEIDMAAGGLDEYGYASGSITLDCCVEKVYPPMPTDLSFDLGGKGGGNPGAISMSFYARRVCC